MRVETVQRLLGDLTSSFTSTLLSSAKKHCKEKKRFDLSRSASLNDSVLEDLREQRVILWRQLRVYSVVEEVRISTRRSLKRVNKEYGKRVKVLKKEQERKFYALLETKSLKEQQRMIRFERNKNQRPGVKRLDSEKLPEYTAVRDYPLWVIPSYTRSQTLASIKK